MKITYIVFCLMLSVSLLSCEEKSRTEKIEDKLEDTGDKAERKLEKAGDKIEDKADDAEDKLDNKK